MWLLNVLKDIRSHFFLLQELVKRDFKKKYKRTVLGMAWSVFSPLLMLFVLRIVFGNFFGASIEHYTIYLFCGLITFNLFSESTNAGMLSLISNAGILTKVKVPKPVFILAVNFQVLINFLLTVIVFFVFCSVDGIKFSPKFALLVYPILTLMIFNMGVGMILSTLYVFFRDIGYLWSIATQIVMYASAIFYTVDVLPAGVRSLLRFNPLYQHILYARIVVLSNAFPDLWLHFDLAAFSAGFLLVGLWMYRHYDSRFMFYV